MSKAFFIDRDGVVVKRYYHQDSGVITTPLIPEQVEFIHGIVDVLHHVKKLGYKIILISNQPNIGLKKQSKENFEGISQKINDYLHKNDISLDGEYYCFHHPFADLEEYREKCDCRKPEPGLLLKASKEHNIDMNNSWFLGDAVTDVQAGNKAGVKTILYANITESDYLHTLEEHLRGIKPDYMVKNIKDIIKIVKS